MVNSGPILIVVSVEQEKVAVLEGLGKSKRFDVFVCGVGIAKAAAKTAKQLATKRYSGVINMGIAGGFPDRAPLGSIVVAHSVIAPEIGAESPEGFISIDELGFGSQKIETYASTHFVGKLTIKAKVKSGVILSVLTATGTTETLNKRMEIMGVLAEAMEGFGVASAAEEYELPFAEVRAISNVVGVRDKSSWDFPAAFQGLKIAAQCMKEVEEHGYCLFAVSE